MSGVLLYAGVDSFVGATLTAGGGNMIAWGGSMTLSSAMDVYFAFLPQLFNHLHLLIRRWMFTSTANAILPRLVVVLYIDGGVTSSALLQGFPQFTTRCDGKNSRNDTTKTSGL